MRTSPCLVLKEFTQVRLLIFITCLSRVVKWSDRVSESSRRVPKNSFTCYFFFHFTLSSQRLWGMLLSARHRTPVPPLLPLASFRTIVLIQRKGSGKKALCLHIKMRFWYHDAITITHIIKIQFQSSHHLAQKPIPRTHCRFLGLDLWLFSVHS